ncbi:MAG: gliding motility protein GldL [Bacteroidetes bacterium]|nr:gliding motility protein GldL [Bacteroidota bacterium]MCL2303159.1 gliding motility protein GldL [Lentimicrobiaceae bacterium]
MSLYKIVRSKAYKNFMAKLYGIGASLVISGALFKILHWPLADQMLMVGMLTEAVIFFFSAFEPLHKEYDWALVYPELETAKGIKHKEHPKGSVTQQLDRMLEEAKIGPELIENLASGMRNLSDNAKQLSKTTDAAVATEGYVANLTKAKDAVQNLTGVYEKSANELSATSDMQVKSIQEMFDTQKQHAQKLQEVQLQNVQKVEQIQEQGNQTIIGNYAKIQQAQEQGSQAIIENYKKIGQIQEQGNQVIVENYKKIQDSTIILANSMNDTAQEAQKHKEEIDKLSKNVAQINAIYANMLAAMTNK